MSGRGANLRPGPRSSERRARGWLPGRGPPIRGPAPGILGPPSPAGAPPPWSRLPEDRRRSISVDEVRQALVAVSPGGAGRARPTPGRRPVTRPSCPPGRSPAGGCGFACCSRTKEKPTLCSPAARRICASHSGEVSFPGGRLQPGEPPLHAALRETNEEIGIDAGAVEVIGQLTPLTTVRSPALVHCFVGSLPHAGARRAWRLPSTPGEVEKVFWVPLAGLPVEGIYHEELWPVVERPGRTTSGPASYGPASYGPASYGPTSYRAIPFFRLDDDMVWGATRAVAH